MEGQIFVALDFAVFHLNECEFLQSTFDSPTKEDDEMAKKATKVKKKTTNPNKNNKRKRHREMPKITEKEPHFLEGGRFF